MPVVCSTIRYNRRNSPDILKKTVPSRILLALMQAPRRYQTRRTPFEGMDMFDFRLRPLCQFLVSQFRTRAALAGCLLAVYLTGSVMAAEPLQLQYGDFREGLEQARRQDLPLLLHFYTDWCGPCQIMEQTVFSSPQLEKTLAGKVVLVKVNGDQHPDLVKMYQVGSYPRDVYLDPQGRVLSSVVGMASLSEYISSALQVEGRYQQSRQLAQARQNSGHSPAPYSTMTIKLGDPEPFPEAWLRPTPPESQASEIDPLSKTELARQDRKPEVVFIAMDGYCPVRLKQDREWIKGEDQHSHIYKQQEYYFSGQEEKEEFISNPEQYAPQLLGCDPVIMWEKDRALPGSTAFAAYYNESLYLFMNEQNREMFRIDPERYIQLRHVLAPRDVEATLIR